MKLTQFVLCAVLASCSSRYAGYRYAPQSDAVTLQESVDGESVGRVLVRCTGLREGGTVAAFRIRVENSSAEVMRLVPEDALLLDVEFREFGAAALPPGSDLETGPGEARNYELEFRFPGDERPDLNGLILRWALRFGDRQFDLSSNFERVESPRTDRWSYYDSPFPRPWGFGLGFHRAYCY